MATGAPAKANKPTTRETEAAMSLYLTFELVSVREGEDHVLRTPHHSIRPSTPTLSINFIQSTVQWSSALH